MYELKLATSLDLLYDRLFAESAVVHSEPLHDWMAQETAYVHDDSSTQTSHYSTIFCTQLITNKRNLEPTNLLYLNMCKRGINEL